MKKLLSFAIAGSLVYGAYYLGNKHAEKTNTPPSEAIYVQFNNDPSGDCKEYIGIAENHHGIPRGLLLAIATAESGKWNKETKKREPYPWAINNAGNNFYPDTWEDAIVQVGILKSQGQKNIDVGCMQINLNYHPDAFDSVKEGFDARNNVEYAAKFLRRLYDSRGSWHEAVACYHNCVDTGKQQKYLAAVFKAINFGE